MSCKYSSVPDKMTLVYGQFEICLRDIRSAIKPRITNNLLDSFHLDSGSGKMYLDGH